MEMKGTRKFAAPPQTVWEALHNSAVLTKCIPGAESAGWRGDDVFFARVNVGLGPVKGSYGAEAQVVEHVAPRHMKAVFNKKGAGASIEGSAVVELVPEGDGTLLTYNAGASLGGTLSALDNALTRPIVEGQLNQFFARLDQQLG